MREAHCVRIAVARALEVERERLICELTRHLNADIDVVVGIVIHRGQLEGDRPAGDRAEADAVVRRADDQLGARLQ